MSEGQEFLALFLAVSQIHAHVSRPLRTGALTNPLSAEQEPRSKENGCLGGAEIAGQVVDGGAFLRRFLVARFSRGNSEAGFGKAPALSGWVR